MMIVFENYINFTINKNMCEDKIQIDKIDDFLWFNMKPNILFFLIDGLRADQCYGSDKKSHTPFLDSLVDNGVYFIRLKYAPSINKSPQYFWDKLIVVK